MRARGGANEAIRALLDLAPPMAEVIRDGEAVEVPTERIVVGGGSRSWKVILAPRDLLVIPGTEVVDGLATDPRPQD